MILLMLLVVAVLAAFPLLWVAAVIGPVGWALVAFLIGLVLLRRAVAREDA